VEHVTWVGLEDAIVRKRSDGRVSDWKLQCNAEPRERPKIVTVVPGDESEKAGWTNVISGCGNAEKRNEASIEESA